MVGPGVFLAARPWPRPLAGDFKARSRSQRVQIEFLGRTTNLTPANAQTISPVAMGGDCRSGVSIRVTESRFPAIRSFRQQIEKMP